jgi:outer membrane lipoprotein-sorting protein
MANRTRWTSALPHFRLWLLVCLSVLVLSSCVIAQAGDLEKVLAQLDDASQKFRSAQSSFTWTQYNKVINDITDTQKGKIYFRRAGHEIEMAADITAPDAKQVVFSGGKIQMYQPRMDQLDVYDASKHREEFESFLVLGFGGSGHDMLQSFNVKYEGTEMVDGVETAKLNLEPKAERIRQSFSHIRLWIDPPRGVSLQQQLFEASGDYRLAKYSDIQINHKVSDGVFKTKTSSNTKVVTH